MVPAPLLLHAVLVVSGPAASDALPPWTPPADPSVPEPGADELAPPLAEPPASTTPDPKPAPTTPAPVAPPPPPAPPAVEDDAALPWAIGGFVDTQYIFNSNLPDNHIFRGTAVSARTGEFNPNLLVGYIRKDPIRSPWMFELALQMGSAADALYSVEPVAGGSAGRYAGVEAFKHIGRAWTGVKTRRGTEVAAGLMLAPTHFGSFWTKDNWHSSITWGYSSVPFFLMGARVWQPITDRFGVGFWLTTGYGEMGDINKAPSGLVNLVLTPIPGLSLVQNVYAGPEDVDMRPEAWRLLLDSQIVYIADRWGIAIVGDYGREKLTAKTGQPVAYWANAMVSVRWHVLGEKHTWGMAVRPEFFYDHGGRIFGAQDVENWMYGGTFTNDIRLFDALLVRLEYRHDRTTAAHGYWYRGPAITDAGSGLASSQHTVLFNFIGYFERKLPGLRK